jgi:hypothetical protein
VSNVMSSNRDSIIHSSFHLNILRVGLHLLSESLSSHVNKSFKIFNQMIKFIVFIN